jgi:hypothetical protein
VRSPQEAFLFQHHQVFSDCWVADHEMLRKLGDAHLAAWPIGNGAGVHSRLALPKFTLACALSNKRVLQDEVAESAVTGRLIAEKFLKTSEVSLKRAEPEYFGRCSFTNLEVLKRELKTSDVSGKPYCIDQELRSAVSGKAGHQREFIICHVTGQPIAKIELVGAGVCNFVGSEECATGPSRAAEDLPPVRPFSWINRRMARTRWGMEMSTPRSRKIWAIRWTDTPLWCASRISSLYSHQALRVWRLAFRTRPRRRLLRETRGHSN